MVPERGKSQVAQGSIRMGAMAVAIHEGVLQTLLGSCVGLALYDRKYRVGGIAHIVLPQSCTPSSLPGKFVDTAVPALLEKLRQFAGNAIAPKAKIVGGATMFATKITRNIGLENVLATERWLEKFRIPIVARDCGGDKGRRMSLEVRTGKVTVEIVGCDPVEL